MRKQVFHGLFAVILSCAAFAVQCKASAQDAVYLDDYDIDAITAGDISEKREAAAIDLAFKYMQKNGTDSDNAAMAKAIYPEFSKAFPQAVVTPAEKLLTPEDCQASAKESIKKAMDKAFPLLSDEELAALAEKKYPLYKKGDHVEVIYAKNPQFPTSVSGVYYGTNRGFVTVGKTRVRIDDMLLIEDYMDEVLKFDPDATAERREEYIKRLQHDTALGRDDFGEKNGPELRKAEVKKFAKLNEERGYTCIDGAWKTVMPFLEAACEKGRAKLARHIANQLNTAISNKLDALQAQSDTLAIHIAMSDKTFRGTAIPAKATVANADDQTEQSDTTETSSGEDEKEGEEENEISTASSNVSLIDPNDTSKLEQQEEESKKQMIMMIVIAGIALIVIIICVLIVMKIKNNREKTRFKRFFEGKGKVQKDFWDLAQSDPKNFKYVAYMFPNLKDASKALTRLTYITALPNGELKCTRDIMFGVYPHQDGAVAFVGGLKFHYALWREASAILPELPGAQYFKVSEEPEVKLDIPDLKEIAKNGEIESLGIEDTTDDEGSFTRCYKYKANSKETAMAFLENFQINEEGIVVQIETEEGIFGKDENGIFTA